MLQRADWTGCQQTVDPDKLVFIDETALKTNLTRQRGWAFGGDRIVEAVPAGRWQTSTLVHAIALDGTRAAMLLDGPIDGICFAGFCESFLGPSLNVGDLVVMDNLNSHKTAAARETITKFGAVPIYLPPYSPDLNPIEMIFSKLKRLIRAQRPRTYSAIIDSTADALRRIAQRDIQNCFQHCGYNLTL